MNSPGCGLELPLRAVAQLRRAGGGGGGATGIVGSPSLRPRMYPGKPSRNVPTIFFVLRAERLAQRWLLVQQHKRKPRISTMADATIRAAVFARPKTTHSPTHPVMKPRYMGSARIDRTPPPPALSAGPWARAFRVPCVRSPTRIEMPRRNQALRARPPSSAMPPGPRFPRESPARTAVTRTRARRIPPPPPGTRSPSATARRHLLLALH